MKNFKRLAIAAAVAVMAFGVTAFASTTASYSTDKIKLDNTAFMDAGVEYTVYLTAKDAAVTDANILYINQGTKDATFWTTGMGPKEGTTITEGAYELTIGGEGLTAFKVPVYVRADGKVAKGQPYAIDNGKYIVYAHCFADATVQASAKLSVTETTSNTTKVSSQTIGEIIGGEWAEGATVSGTLAIGILTTNRDAVFTVSAN